MNILLLNDNPVVNKLVTLSAQKTSDDLNVVNTIDAIEKDSYDLFVVDDTLYNNDVFTQIKQKISFKKSLYICSRDAEVVDTFDTVLKKPFLPTDLVELFSSISKEVATISISNDDEPLIIIEDDVIADDFEEEINLDIGTTESILDNDEAQKVKELLDETSDEFEDFDDELDLSDIDLSLSTDNDIILNDDDEEEEEEEEIEFDLEESLELESEDDLAIEPELELEDSLDLEEENNAESEEEPELELEESLEFESKNDAMIEEESELEENLELDNLDIEDQIKTAVSKLSEEDLEEEVSEETLLEIAETEINSLDTLTSRDLKLAIGEEVEDDNLEKIIVEQNEQEEMQDTSPTNGVEALKNLLSALTDKNVAASMKGMKISIHITLGDN